MNDEEVAFRVVRLYFEEIARLGFKRQLDLDQMINAYFYALKKVKDKEAMKKIIIELDKKPEMVKTTTTTTETKAVPVEPAIVQETTTTTETKPSKTITDIIEGIK